MSDKLLIQYLSSTDVQCPRCQYNLRGIDSPRCPECGLKLGLLVSPERPSTTCWVFALVAAGIAAAHGLDALVAIYAMRNTTYGFAWGHWYSIVVVYPTLFAIPCFVGLICFRKYFWNWNRLLQWSIASFLILIALVTHVAWWSRYW